MSKTRIHELAKELNISSKEIIDSAEKLGMNVKNHMSTLESDEVNTLKTRFSPKQQEKKPTPRPAQPNADQDKRDKPSEGRGGKIIYDRTKELKDEEKRTKSGNRSYSSDRSGGYNNYKNRDNSNRPDNRDNRSRDGENTGSYQNRDGSQGRSNNYQNRDGSQGRSNNYQNRDGSQGRSNNYQNRDGSQGRSNNYQNRDGSQGRSSNYQNRDGSQGRSSNYQNRDGSQGRSSNYQNRDGSQGRSGDYQNRDGSQGRSSNYQNRDNTQGRDNSQGRSGDYRGTRPQSGPRTSDNRTGYNRSPGFAKDKDSSDDARKARPPRKTDKKKPEFEISGIQEKTPSKKKKTKKDKIVVTFDTDRLESKSKKAKKILKEELVSGDRGTRDFDFGKKVKKKSGTYKERTERERSEKLDEQLKREVVYVPEEMTVSDFADIIHKPVNDLIVKLMGMGIMTTLNQNIDYDTAALIAIDYDITLEVEVEEEENHIEAFDLDFEDKPKDLVKRAPVVTVMGHVDHGKTSLLDAIRNTGVAEGEAGGITQHIGASEIMYRNEKIVFLDTPGHEAFTSLRARGAKITDIAILVVAADDGVMPQTIEAIDHAKAAGVPIIVAINKIDKPGANPDRVKQELADRGVLIEEWGGDVIAVPVSAKTGEGLETLLETVLLVSEMLELKANPNRPGIGTVIEAKVVKGRGIVATIILEKGTMKIGDPIVAGITYGKVKALYNSKLKKVKQIGPATSAEIDGLNEIPQAGEKVYVTPDERTARFIAEKQATIYREKHLHKNSNVTLEDLFSKIKEGVIKDLNIIVKADVHGSVEALKQSLLKLSNDEVRVNIIHSNVGAISESDVILASASNAIIIGFNVRPSSNVSFAAEQEGVDIRTYSIIYDAINDVETAMKGMLDPEFKEVVLGRVEVRATFKIPTGVIAGAYVTNGKIARNANVRVIRDGIVIFDGKISSLKRFKDDVREVQQGYECGIGIERFNDLQENDEIEAYVLEEVKRA
jgi:translation initiation factor IF-2